MSAAAGQSQSDATRVNVVTLGCARNEVDSEELAARLDSDGWRLVADAEDADVIMVNTCGFIEQAKRDSIETLLAAGATGRPVVAVGCLAERYGSELAHELPEATVLGFDDYSEISSRLRDAYHGVSHEAHRPTDRRLMLPLAPVERSGGSTPGHSNSTARRLLHAGPSQPVKLASGCDRRCSFCAIPRFRGAFVSRRPTDVFSEVVELVDQGVKEVVLVSENSTSYGKDLGDIRLLDSLLPQLGEIPGLEWIRVSYLQPAEVRPSLVAALATTPSVARYFDLSFQHASGPVLRRMRRFGDADSFLALIDHIRDLAPDAGIRSNFIVGFPGETEADVAILEEFLIAAELDAIGVFGYSDEDGTEAVDLPDHVPAHIVEERLATISRVAEAVMEQRAEARVGRPGRLLVEGRQGRLVEGRCEHQGPEDASTLIPDAPAQLAVGDVVDVTIVGTDGVDLIARLAAT
ncbi:MAG: 30S ribosomal protein S12 methylthiotransferase RimO [Actinobacteria bacterium]|nr:30S ribosomal protein S12 methylthiotransferase RimO [Actinomycetota bacterium]